MTVWLVEVMVTVDPSPLAGAGASELSRVVLSCGDRNRAVS